MNGITLLIIIVFGILILLGIIVISFYNKLLFKKNRVIEKFTAINDSLNGRITIINKIVNILTNDKYHEDNLILELNKVSNEINKENIINKLLLLISRSDEILKKSLSLENIYPELKNNKEYLKLVDEFKNNQYKLMYAVEIYNEEVGEYNNYKNKNGIKIISKIFKLPNYNYYKK
jgi:LemA protein